LAYFAEIQIGTPPRTFRVLVDIGSPETFVTSIDCGPSCAPPGDQYDPASSSTSQSSADSGKLDYGWLVATGNYTTDAFSIANLHLENQPFISASNVQINGIAWDDVYQVHGVLGLTPSAAGSGLNKSSPIVNLADSGLLEENKFTMRLREPRELAFGGVNHSLYAGEFSHVPLTNETFGSSLAGRWQTSAHYMALLGGESDRRLNVSLAGMTASFGSKTAFMYLPHVAAAAFWDAIGFERMMFLPPSVACERRATLPELVFNLAGQRLTLTPWDYLLEWPVADGEVRCVSAVLSTGAGPEDGHEIYLGTAFLRAFYTAFDLDEKRISCKSSKARSPSGFLR
jgi:saccharopepsin